MKTRELIAIGIPAGRCAETAKQILQTAQAAKRSMRTTQDDLKRVAASPEAFVHDQLYGTLAQRMLDHARITGTFKPRLGDAPYRIWVPISSPMPSSS